MHVLSERTVRNWCNAGKMQGTFLSGKTFLADTGMLPETEADIKDWLQLVREETEYFFRVLTHFTIGGIQPLVTEPFMRLFSLNGQQIKAIRQEMKKYVNDIETALGSGAVMLNHYLPDKVLKSATT